MYANRDLPNTGKLYEIYSEKIEAKGSMDAQEKTKKVSHCGSPLKFVKSQIKWIYVKNLSISHGNEETSKIVKEFKENLKDTKVEIHMDNKPKSKSNGLTIDITCKTQKNDRDIVGTGNALYLKVWRKEPDNSANNANLKRICFMTFRPIEEFNEKGKGNDVPIINDPVDTKDWGFFFYNSRLAKGFVIGKNIQVRERLPAVDIGKRGDPRIPTIDDLSDDAKFFSNHSNFQLMHKNTDSFTVSCGRLDILVATKHLQSEMHRRIVGKDGLRNDYGSNQRGAESEVVKEDIRSGFLRDLVTVGRLKNNNMDSYVNGLEACVTKNKKTGKPTQTVGPMSNASMKLMSSSVLV